MLVTTIASIRPLMKKVAIMTLKGRLNNQTYPMKMRRFVFQSIDPLMNMRLYHRHDIVRNEYAMG